MTEAKLITREELMTAPMGLYRLGQREHRREYQPVEDVFFTGQMELYARVTDMDVIPLGLDCTIRPDGLKILEQWAPVDRNKVKDQRIAESIAASHEEIFPDFPANYKETANG